MLSFETGLVKANRIVLALLLAVILIVVFVNVVLRYSFGTSLAWAEEVARFLMVAGTFLGAGLALREGRLVSIDFLPDLLPENLRKFLRAALAVVMIVFMALLVWYGAKFVAFAWDKETMATQIPRGVPFLAIPLGAALFILHLLLIFRRYMRFEFETDSFVETEALDDAEDLATDKTATSAAEDRKEVS